VKSSLAIGRIRLAIDRLATDQPFIAGILAQWKIIEDDTISTMAIGFRQGKLTLLVSPRFCESISLDEIQAVLCHEANHCVMGHVFHRPEPTENHRALTIAAETVANQWVSGPLPGKPVLLADYPMLSPEMTTEERYEKLKDIVPDDKVLILTLDDHTTWAEIEAAGVLAGVVINSNIAKVVLKLTPQQLATMPDALRNQIMGAGTGSGGSVCALGQGVAVVDWKKALRRFVGRIFQRRTTYSKPPRRFPEMIGIIPGKSRSASKPKILTVIDTSGSMNPTMLSNIAAELSVMAKTNAVEIIEVDTKIKSRYKFSGKIDTFRGRGGTDLRVVFKHEILRGSDLLILFTDGQSPMPPSPPKIPVIWAMTKGRKPVEWGKEIRLY